MVNWGLVATLGIAGAAVAGIVVFRDRIVSGVTSAGFTAGQTAGAIPSSIAGGIQSGLNPLRTILGQPQANIPTYNYKPPTVVTSNPAVQAAQYPQAQVTAPAPALPTVPTPLTSNFRPNPSSSSTRRYAASRNSRYVAGSQTQTAVYQRTNPSTGRVQTRVSSTPGVSAYYAGTPTRRTTIHFSPTNKVTTQLSQAAINTYRKYGVKLT